jgi:hypothetical protein
MFITAMLLVTATSLSSPGPPKEICIFKEELGTISPTALRQAVGESARLVGIEDLPSLGASDLLVLPECRSFPAQALPQITGFLDRGGHLLAVGGPAFERLVFPSNGRWLTEAEVLASITPAHTLVDCSKVDLESAERGTNQPQVQPRYELLPDGVSVDLELVEPVGWDTLSIAPVTPAPAEHNVLWFRASGRGKTEAILVELREQDGTRWMATAPVTPDERPVGIHRDRFEYWRDSLSQGRGGEGDRVRFDEIALVSVGYASSHQQLASGTHGFTIRQISTGTLSGDLSVPPVPKLEGLCPAYKLFEATPVRYESVPGRDNKSLSPTPGRAILSPVARPMHASPDRDYVWQPLVKGFNAEGHWCATPLSTTRRSNGATWTFCGWQPPVKQMARIVKTVAEQVCPDSEQADPPPALLPGGEQGECVKVVDGQFSLGGKRWFAHGINFWPLYVSGMEPVGYFSHWLSPWAYVPELIDMDLATLESLGVNLVSIQYGKPEEAPQLRDFLARCGRHGIKVNLWLTGAHPTEPRGDDDLSKRPYLELMRAADLRGNPHLFAYDLAWEPVMGYYDGRKKHDHLFEAWLVEQYGGVEQAEKIWGCPANRRDGKVTGPYDEQLTQDGPHRPMVAAYRRFVDDLVSRRYREIIRLARAIDDSHLFGVRTGCGGTGVRWAVPMFPYPLTAGAAHLDFLSPEGYGYGPENASDAAFVTKYARWAGNGKPVFWAEFGVHVWLGGEPALERQGALYRTFAEIMQRSGADGWAGWWYPGGYRVDERSDYGIVAPDRTIRPSARVLQETAARFKSEAPPPDGPPIIVEPEKAPMGLASTIEASAAAFVEPYKRAAPLPAIRTRGTGTTSADCPLTGLDGAPYAGGPPEFLNAEIVPLGKTGENLTLQVINTGEATLLPEDCVLRVRSGEASQEVRLKAPLPRFARQTLVVAAPSEPATLVMHAQRFGDFGERVRYQP